MKKIISMILCAVMVLSCFAGVSFAVEAAQSRAIKNSIFIYRDGMFTENIDENDNVFYANTYALENGEHMPIYTESSNYDVGLYVNITYNYKTGYIKKMTKVDSTTFTADAVDSDGDSNDAFYLSVASANENVIITDGGILDLAGNAYEVAEDITIFLIEGTAYSKISMNKLASLSQKAPATYAGLVNADGEITALYIVYGGSTGSGSSDSDTPSDITPPSDTPPDDTVIYIYRSGMFTENIDEEERVFYANTYALVNGVKTTINTTDDTYATGLYIDVEYDDITGCISNMTRVDSSNFSAAAVDSNGNSNDAFYLSTTISANTIIFDGGILDIAGYTYDVAEDIEIVLIEGTAYSKISMNKLASLSQKGSATYAGVVNAEGQVTDLYVVYTKEGHIDTDKEYTIKSLVLRDVTSHAELTDIPAGNFLAEVTVVNNTSENTDTILLATYGKDGGMLNLTYLYTNIEKGHTATLGTYIKNSGNVTKVKAFVLDSLLGLNPMANAMEITKDVGSSEGGSTGDTPPAKDTSTTVYIYRSGMFTENIDEEENVYYANTYALVNGVKTTINTELNTYTTGLYIDVEYDNVTGYISDMTKVDGNNFTADAVDSDGDSNDAFYLAVATASANTIIFDGGILDIAGETYDVAEDIEIVLVEGTAYSKISMNKLASLSEKGTATYAGVVNAEGQVTALYVVYTKA